MKAIIGIPARMGASRFPSKPLALIKGKPMIQHVWELAMAAKVGPVVVGAGEEEIKQVIEAQGGVAVLTDPALPSGTDRVAAAVEKFDPSGEYEIVINLQGDLPTFKPPILKTLVEAFTLDPSYDVATLITPIHSEDEITNPHTVKVAIAWDSTQENLGRALYFSRATIPYNAETYVHHVGIYAYKRAALRRFISLSPSPLERCESLEQLRALGDGMKFAVRMVDDHIVPVDRPTDLAFHQNK